MCIIVIDAPFPAAADASRPAARLHQPGQRLSPLTLLHAHAHTRHRRRRSMSTSRPWHAAATPLRTLLLVLLLLVATPSRRAAVDEVPAGPAVEPADGEAAQPSTLESLGRAQPTMLAVLQRDAPGDAADASRAAATSTATASAAPEAVSSKVGRPVARSAARAARMQAAAAAAAQADQHAAAQAQGGVTAAAAVPATYGSITTKHNTYRATHQAPALSWDTTVAASAAAYAVRCIWGHDSSNAAYGENLYASTSTNQAGVLDAAITAWCVQGGACSLGAGRCCRGVRHSLTECVCVCV